MTPVLIALLIQNSLVANIIALVLFVAAAISDYYDGKIAREMGTGSRVGKFLDPLADKVLVLGTLITLAVLLPHIVPWWAVVLIAIRDIYVTAQRSYAESKGKTVRTLPMAKTKTTFQLIFLIGVLVMLVVEKLPQPLGPIGNWVLESPIPYLLLLLVVVLTIGTGLVYALNPTESLES